MKNKGIIRLIHETYQWFNEILNPSNPFNENYLYERFEPNFMVEMNGEVIIKDYLSFLTHFKEFRNSGSILKIYLPLQEIIVADDKGKCVARYNIAIIGDGKITKLKVMAICHISEKNRLQRMNQVF